jgi:riboflavin kinase/FMN adenylyltransferase
MLLYRSASCVANKGPDCSRIVAIGVFDGLHRGHQTIVRKAVALANGERARSMVFTFEPMPMEFFAPDEPPPRLTRFRERFELLDRLGVDEMFCPRFAALRTLGADEFIEDLLVGALHARVVIVGDDFKFGLGRTGSVADLELAGQSHSFEVRRVEPVLWQGRRISSTAIREVLGRGDLAAAKAMLGRDYTMSGRVVHGRKLGKDLGFPTANINLKRRASPIEGIFAVRVGGLGRDLRDAVASVGTRPTIGGGEPLLEVFIFDFEEEIYGRYLTVHFVSRIREERKFEDIESLREQMQLDVAAARAALAA